jgi:hypothetical protein
VAEFRALYIKERAENPEMTFGVLFAEKLLGASDKLGLTKSIFKAFLLGIQLPRSRS